MSKAKFNAKKFERPGLTEDEIEEIKEAFDLFDTNSTGIITVQDLKVGLRALGFEPGKNEIKRLVKNLNRPIVAKDNQDKEKQGTISLDFKDFSEIMAMKMSEPAAENELRKAFILFSQEEKAKTLTMDEFK